MKNFIIFKIFTFLFAISLPLANAQNTLDHNTGAFEATVFDNAFFGHGAFGSGGNGIKLTGGSDAVYSSSFLLGSASSKISGYMHSLTIATGNEIVNSTPFSGFTSNSDFNQIATAVYSDNGAPSPNQTGLTVTQTTYSNTGDNFIIVQFELLNNTGVDKNGIYAGLFGDWDVGMANYTINLGGYDAARNLAYQFEDGGSVDSNYYGIAVLSQFGGARVTAYDATSEAEIRDSVFNWISTFLDEDITVPADYRTFIGSGPFNIPNGSSVKAGFAFIAGSNLTDLQMKADEAHLKWNNNVIPVELVSFTAIVNQKSVELKWKTSTEINNRAFEIERARQNGRFQTIGIKEGAGTTTEEMEYSFTDNNITPGQYLYRVKQIDFDGTFKYSEQIEVNINLPLQYSLSQNFPNPFNPSTKIKYTIPVSEYVSLTVYDLLGNEIEILVNDIKEAAEHEVDFNSANLSSGFYIYRLKTSNYSKTYKMLILK